MTTNEKIIIGRLKENKDFLCLINQPVDNITIGNTSRAIKGLSSNYMADPDGTIQYLLNLVSLTCYIGPIKSDDTLVAPHQIVDAVRAVINNYFMIVCIDKVITKYRVSDIDGFSAEHTWRESYSDIAHTVFFMDSKDKSLRLEIELADPELVKGMSVSEFRQAAQIKVRMKDSMTNRDILGLRGAFGDMDKMVAYLVRQVK